MEFEDPGEALCVSRALASPHGVAARVRLGAWVAEASRRDVAGVVVTCPPWSWISTIAGLSNDHRRRIAQRVVEASAVAVAEAVRGRRLGRHLLQRAARDSRQQGYRIMLGTLLRENEALAGYYADVGFLALPPGEPLYLLDPLGMVLCRPGSARVRWLWMPLHPEVAVQQVAGPSGGTVPAISGALAAPEHAPERVIHHADGSATFEGDGNRLTVPAQALRLLESVRAQQVTDAEVRAAAAEAIRYGFEPLIAAQLRKSSGMTLEAFFGR
ncbi:GNAT family N-acetyltransferase [Streptomyces sp. NPDC059122]|uniref:GNAT family N-acetyltransferase n=1 Tax=Streptomyces sp. NPDC059122 TaxID=3346732 RepID=UPI00367994D9